MSVIDHPLFVGTPIGLLSAWLVWLGYKRSKKADEVAQASGTIGQIYTGFDQLVKNLKDDNSDLRTRMDGMEARFDVRLKLCEDAREELIAQLGQLTQLMKKNGFDESEGGKPDAVR